MKKATKIKNLLNVLQDYYSKFPEKDTFRDKMEEVRPIGEGPYGLSPEEFDDLIWHFFPKSSDFDAPEDEGATEPSEYTKANSISLANLPLQGWFNQSVLDETLEDDTICMQLQEGLRLQGQVRADVLRNSAHILTRCNNPNDWGENKCGLVYGMVQSGKTNSMLTLAAMAYKQGYDMVIVLTTNSVDLRQQTQNRFDATFSNHADDAGSPYKVISKTSLGDKYPSKLSPYDHFQGQHHGKLKQYLVLKKVPSVLKSYPKRIEEYVSSLKASNQSIKALILDDEADHSSLNTKKTGASPVHSGIAALLDAFDQVDYIAYTATPQGCIAQDIQARFGYPRDFIWVLDPFSPKDHENRVMTGSYVGGHEFFSKLQNKTVSFIGEDDWPQHKLTREGNYRGVYEPEQGIDEDKKTRLPDAEKEFLEAILAGRKDIPESLVHALLEFIWSGCYRWLDHGVRAEDLENTLTPLHQLVPDHAFMANITYITDNQNLSERVISRAWDVAKHMFEVGHSTSKTLGKKLEMHAAFFGSAVHSRADVFRMGSVFTKEVERPFLLRDSKGNPIQSKGFIYVLNSSTEDVLNYSPNDETRVKPAAIVLGGNKLSRGLTVEGLSVSYYGRSQRTSLADTVTQMGRWFGHKNVPGQSYLHLLRVYMHRDSLRLFRDIAAEELRFRAMLKESINNGESPSETLYVMEQSPLFKLTNPQKGRQLSNYTLNDYRRNRATYKRFSPHLEDLVHNANARQALFKDLEASYGSPKSAWQRGRIWKDVELSHLQSFLTEFKYEVQTGASPDALQQYLQLWMRDVHSLRVNIVDMTIDGKRPDRRKRRSVPVDVGPNNIPAFLECELDSLLGGQGDNSLYLGDAVIDFDDHSCQDVSQLQAMRSTPLFLLYRIDVNYISKKLSLGAQHSDLGYVDFSDGALAYAMIFPTDNRPRIQSRFNKSVANQL